MVVDCDLLRSRLLLLALLIASGASAQDDPGEPVPVEADSTGRLVAPVIEVEGFRIDAQGRLDRRVLGGTVLEASSWNEGSRDAADVLSRAVGLHVRDTGGVGGMAQLSIRGSTPAQVPVYLDGVLLNAADRGAVDLADVSLAQLDRIEVYRGAAPLTLGNASLGGAVHLFSGDGGGWNASLSRGTFETWTGDLTASRRVSDWTFSARAHGARSQNDWEYLDDRRTPFNPDDDQIVRRINNDAAGYGGQLQMSRRLGAGTLRLSEIVDRRDQGLPGAGVRPSETARSRVFSHQVRAAWTSRPLAQTRWREIAVHHRLESQKVVDLNADLTGVARDRTDRLDAVGLSAAGAFRPYGATVWRLETRYERLRSEDLALDNGEGEPQVRATAAAAWQPTLRFGEGRLALSPGLRAEFHEQWWNASESLRSLPTGDDRRSSLWSWTAQAGLRYELDPELSLRANLGVFRRVPTLLELFGDRGTTSANPDLRPEEGVNRDLGLVWSRPREGRRVAFTAFANDAFDLISFVRTSPVTARAVNLGRAEIKGLEFEVDMGRMGAFGYRMSATRLWTKDLSDDVNAFGKSLPYRPGLEVEIAPSLHLGRLRLDLEIFALGDNFQQSGEFLRVPGRTLLASGARWRLDDRWSLQARVENLTDEDVQDFFGEPLPGRRFTLALRTSAVVAGGNDR